MQVNNKAKILGRLAIKLGADHLQKKEVSLEKLAETDLINNSTFPTNETNQPHIQPNLARPFYIMNMVNLLKDNLELTGCILISRIKTLTSTSMKTNTQLGHK